MPDPKNNQEVFDFVVGKIREQGCKSIGEDFCAYRGPNGLKCAAGWLIPDEEYTPEMEEWGGIAQDNVKKGYASIAKEYFAAKGYDTDLVIALQRSHDNIYNENSEIIAKNFGLKYS